MLDESTQVWHHAITASCKSDSDQSYKALSTLHVDYWTLP